jgi:hypothetical protein
LESVQGFHLQQQHKEPLNMAEQKQSGLGGTKPRPQLDALGKFRMAVMPDTKSKSLNEILEEMPDKERNSIESYAKMILRMTTPYSGSYYQQAKRLYPRIGKTKHILLSELLQAIQPRENTDGPEEEEARRSKERLAMSEAMLKKYGGNGLGKKARSDSLSENILDAEEITERVMHAIGFGETKKDNAVDVAA